MYPGKSAISQLSVVAKWGLATLLASATACSRGEAPANKTDAPAQPPIGQIHQASHLTVIYSNLPAPRVSVVGEFRTPQMRSPARVATNANGDIFVTDPGANLVHALSPHGEPLFTIPVNDPLGVTVDGRGNIYVSDGSTGSVRKFDPAGRKLLVFGAGAGEFGRPTDLEWNPEDGVIYAIDSATNTIGIYGTDGVQVGGFGGIGTTDGLFRTPTSAAYDPMGQRILVGDLINARIQIFDPNGGYVAKFGQYGTIASRYVRINGMTMDRSGRVYVVDAFHMRVQVVDTAGGHITWIGKVGSYRGQLRGAVDVTMDPFNRLLVTSAETGKVVVYGIDNYQTPTRRHRVAASVALSPTTLTLSGGGQWITAYVEIPRSEVSRLVFESVALEGVWPDRSSPSDIGDFDNDGVPDRMFLFDRAQLVAALPGPGKHLLTFVGALESGEEVVGQEAVVLFDQ